MDFEMDKSGSWIHTDFEMDKNGFGSKWILSPNGFWNVQKWTFGSKWTLKWTKMDPGSIWILKWTKMDLDWNGFWIQMDFEMDKSGSWIHMDFEMDKNGSLIQMDLDPNGFWNGSKWILGPNGFGLNWILEGCRSQIPQQKFWTSRDSITTTTKPQKKLCFVITLVNFILGLRCAASSVTQCTWLVRGGTSQPQNEIYWLWFR